jgi:hypothetical protein
MCESLFFVRYRRAEKQLELFAATTEPRYITDCEILDYNTVAGSLLGAIMAPIADEWSGVDKFGNFFVSRLPEELTHDEDDALQISAADSILNGAPNKVGEGGSLRLHRPDCRCCRCKRL